ncbi:hypothetical protein [Burkholderia oklahomensis]|uniref:hypothetical protein n=1 Tax=Burkholderia oklahomensis TaxID=342113 RepID=UPI000AF1C5AC|nr:hypothetical protein [Burkholderia oklahomensis]QPS39300.1 hypothetical protein I6G57_17865 [Burkholderia oklahomensis]
MPPSGAIPDARFLVMRSPAAFARKRPAGARRFPLAAFFRNSIIFATRLRVYLREKPVWKCVKFQITSILARFGERALFLSGLGAYWAIASRGFRGGGDGRLI